MDIKSLRYSKEHIWVNIEDNNVRIGITDYAQNELGDIVFIELPTVNKRVKKGDVVGTIESVKSVSDIVAPINGSIKDFNKILEDEPNIINSDPYGRGWIFIMEVEDIKDLDQLLNYDEYIKLVDSNV